MKAVALTEYLPIDDPRSLFDTELPTPEPGKRDLLVRVKAISVNPVDTKVRAPKAGTEATPKILGWDAAGIVEAVGEDVENFKPGDEVYYAGDVTRPGSNAEFQLVDERIVSLKPSTLSFAEAAAFPLVTITAWESLYDRMQLLGDNPTLLIIGGAGGVGSIAIQLAKLAGVTVIATASRPETKEWVLGMGADHVINHREPLEPQLAEIGFPEVDFIANFNNTDAYWETMANVIKPLGRIVGIVENKGPLELGLLKSKSASFAWEFMFTRSMYQTPDMHEQGEVLEEAAELIDSGAIRKIHTEILTPINAENLRITHRKLESGTTIGKVVLEGWE